MLDPWIIEEILRREEERHREEEHGRVEIPAESPRYRERESSKPPTEDTERGVLIIDI